jgi:hypothetical protein
MSGRRHKQMLRLQCQGDTFSPIWGRHDRRQFMVKSFKVLAVVATAFTLSACGQSDGERTATGAVMGGALAAITGESIVNGALIGGAVGAVSCSVAPGAPNCY